MGSLQEHFFSKTSIPADQIHGIDEKLLSGPTDAVAAAYEETVRNVLEKSGGALDLAVLGFGPDVSASRPDHYDWRSLCTDTWLPPGPHMFVVSRPRALGGNDTARGGD
jgi:hypothetical protein